MNAQEAIEIAKKALEHYAAAEALSVPDDWDYPGMGGGPDADQLERKDIGAVARKALEELAEFEPGM